MLVRAILFVKDLERATSFYRDGLGLPVVEERIGWVQLGVGATLALRAIPTAIADTIEMSSPPAPCSETPFELVFGVPDLATARMRLIARGASMREPTTWGTCDGVDPEGNVFQLTQSS